MYFLLIVTSCFQNNFVTFGTQRCCQKPVKANIHTRHTPEPHAPSMYKMQPPQLRFGRDSDILGGPLWYYTRPWHCLVWTQHKWYLWCKSSTRAYQRWMTHQLKSSGGKWGLGLRRFRRLFHHVWLKCPDANWYPQLQEVRQSNEAPTMEWCSLRVLCWPLAMQHPALALLSRVAP